MNNCIDKREISYILPTKILKFTKVVGGEKLLEEKAMQIGLNETSLTKIDPNGFIILDYGKELCGGIRILTYFANSAKVRIRLGESASECCSELGFKGSTNDHSLRDIVTPLVNYSDMKFLDSGFRFVRLDNVSEEEIFIKSVYAVSYLRKLHYKGDFECSDALINDIYKVARYTLHLNMQSMLWDGIKRDRLVWIGDIHPESMAINCIFDNDECIEQALDFAKIQAPLPRFMNDFPTYSLWWIIILKDYYLQNGNINYLMNQKNYLVGLLEIMDKMVDEDGKINFPFLFLDWQTHDKADEEGGVCGLFVFALNCAKYLLNELDLKETLVTSLIKKLLSKKYEIALSKQALAMQVLSHQLEPYSAVDFLINGGAKGLSTFMSYYILSAIADAKKTETALMIMKEYYGGMLKSGATTFWEDFNVDWLADSGRIDELNDNLNDIHGDFGDYCYKGFRHSLCHGWSCGVVPFLTKYVLGVEVLEKGCKTIRIKPYLANLTYVKGKYPTKYGIIEIEHRLINGEIKSKIIAPKEIKIIK